MLTNEGVGVLSTKGQEVIRSLILDIIEMRLSEPHMNGTSMRELYITIMVHRSRKIPYLFE